MADKAALVDQIKAIQRGDPEAKQQWWDYCEQQLGGVKDPNRHDAGVLEDFLNSIGVAPDRASRPPQKRHSEGGKGGGYGGYKGDKGGYDSGSKGQSYGYSQPPAYDGWGGYGGGGGGGGGGGNYHGGPQQQEWGGGGGAGGGAGGGDAGLADMIKTGQRRSQHWKSAWQAYCIKCGNGFNDPTRYDEHFLLDFLDYVGQLVVQDLGPAQPNHPPPAPVHHYSNEPPIGAGKRPVGGGSQPPAKRQAVGGPEPRRGGYKPAEFDKAELVNRVKDLQRSSPDAKSAWWTFCEEHTQGIKDPNRHDAPVLLKFLQGWD